MSPDPQFACPPDPDMWLWLSGELPMADAVAFVTHVSICSACRDRIRAIDSTLAVYTTLPLPDVSDERFEQALTTAARPPTILHETGPSPTSLRTKKLGQWGMRLGVALVLLTLGTVVGQSWSWQSDTRHVENEAREAQSLLAIVLLQQPSAADRLRGITWAEEIGVIELNLRTALAEAVRYDTNVNVRRTAATVLGASNAGTDVAAILARALLEEDSPLVQLTLIEVLDSINSADAHLGIEQLLDGENLDPVVRRRARESVTSNTLREQVRS